VFELAIRICSPASGRHDAGAGGHGSLFAVADGLGGHGTGWLAARLAIRALAGAHTARFVGVADEVPDEWGWSGALQSRSAALVIYEACERLLGPLSGELAAAFCELDRAIARIPELPFRLTGPMTSCTAVSLAGTRLSVAHAGIGRALLVRGGACESLVEEQSVRHVTGPSGERVALPAEVICGALGLRTPVETIERDVAPGDIIVLASRRLALPDDELVTLVTPAAHPDELVERIARAAPSDRPIALAVGIVT
jgi:serine/threonine protein phosphatase PrpC